MKEQYAGILRDAQRIVDGLASALVSGSSKERRRAVVNVQDALDGLVEIVTVTPGSAEGNRASNLLTTAFRVAREHGARLTADSNPTARAVVDAWNLGRTLREIPSDGLPSQVAESLAETNTVLGKFGTERMRDLLRGLGVPEAEIPEMLSLLE